MVPLPRLEAGMINKRGGDLGRWGDQVCYRTRDEKR